MAILEISSFPPTGKPNLLDPTDEELKEKVKQKELEFNADLKKVVKYRAQAPSALAKLSREICESESMEAENLKIELSATDTSGKLQIHSPS